MRKKEIIAAIVLITIVIFSLLVPKQDRFYTEWLDFNKARAAIVDIGILNIEKDFFTSAEYFCIKAGWWQDSELLPAKKLITTTPTFREILFRSIENIDILQFIKTYKFKHWLWLLLTTSLLVVLLNIKNRKALFLFLFAIGVILLLITRDVERVTVPLIILWLYVVSECLKSYRVLNSILLVLFTGIFYYYLSGQLQYTHFKEHTALQNEAHDLISKSNKVCEVSVNYPTGFSRELNTVFKANYLFYENNWMQLNDKEILPTGWLSRNEFFYKTHKISDSNVKRKYKNYHDYLMDSKTAFFGSKFLIKDKFFNRLLDAYNRRYLKEKPNCKHKTFIVAESKHFAISQIRIDCNTTKKKDAF